MQSSPITRREALLTIAAGAATAAGTSGCGARVASESGNHERRESAAASSTIERVAPLSFPFETRDPFLFCVHHDDHYPAGNPELGPNATLSGRNLGQDFDLRNGFRMYHGKRIPGFPQHPHRGFETVTFVRKGIVDHSDSLGAAGRYGGGDVQWMTAGGGVLHAEMFPLLNQEEPNHLELFQIWLNLPARKKMVAPDYKMIWNEQIPRHEFQDAAGRKTLITLVAGQFEGISPPSPPPNSWASEPDSDVAIWNFRIEPDAQVLVPAAHKGTNRTLYVYSGAKLRILGRQIPSSSLVEVRADVPLSLQAGDELVEVLLLQGKPIGEPVVQHGPFVMNTQAEIVQTIRDYQRTQFGGWPWNEADPVHGNARLRFARHADGSEETPT